MSQSIINQLDFNDFKSLLNFNEISGLDAQIKMAPPYREKLIQENKNQITKKPRVASILILLYKKNNEWFFPAILRNTYKGVHSNQIGFPGGKVEKIDTDLKDTAIRESFEEINSNPKDIEILGSLTKLYIPPSHFIVYPFIGLYHAIPDFIPCDREVKEIIHIKLSDFTLNNNVIKKEFTTNHQKKIVPAYRLETNQEIWGASAMILSEFKDFIKKSLSL